AGAQRLFSLWNHPSAGPLHFGKATGSKAHSPRDPTARTEMLKSLAMSPSVFPASRRLFRSRSPKRFRRGLLLRHNGKLFVVSDRSHYMDVSEKSHFVIVIDR